MGKKFILQADYNFGWNYILANPDVNAAEKLEKCYFYNIDKLGMKVDAILWESHCFLPQECESNNTDIYQCFKGRGIDMMQVLIDACHKRGIESIFHHRISEVDSSHVKKLKGKDGWNKTKLSHPDWIIKTWWREGHWNFASEGLRQFKLDYITSIMRKYNFDGICIDFSRHLPCLPVGRQWEERHCLTQFMCDLKNRIKRISPAIKIGAKVPENNRVCHDDGFDMESWIQKDAVDFLVLGSRSVTVEVDWYKQITMGHDVMLYPCWDVHHSSDALHFMPKEFYRGLILNWFYKGADGIVGFNFAPAPVNEMKKIGVDQTSSGGAYEEGQDFKEYYESYIESQDANKKRKYVAERRGGYPYITGSFTTNCYAPLPAEIPNDGGFVDIPVETIGDFGGRKATVKLLISNAKEGIDHFAVLVNGTERKNISENFHFIDRQIFWPEPQKPSGRTYCMTDNPSELLVLSECIDGCLLSDKTIVSVAVIDRTDYILDNITVERVELIIDGET